MVCACEIFQKCKKCHFRNSKFHFSMPTDLLPPPIVCYHPPPPPPPPHNQTSETTFVLSVLWECSCNFNGNTWYRYKDNNKCLNAWYIEIYYFFYIPRWPYPTTPMRWIFLPSADILLLLSNIDPRLITLQQKNLLNFLQTSRISSQNFLHSLNNFWQTGFQVLGN